MRDIALGGVLGKVFGVLGRDGFEVLLMNELSAFPSKVGGSTSCRYRSGREA